MSAVVPQFVLFENVLRGPYGSAGLTTNTAPDTGAVANVQDWRVKPIMAWDAGGGDFTVEVELAAATAVDSFVIANHTAFTADIESVAISHKTNSGDSWTEIASSSHTFVSDRDVAIAFTQTSDVFFKFHFTEDTVSAAEFSIGELTLGRRVTNFGLGGTRPDIDAHGFEVISHRTGSPNGSPLSSDPRFARRMFQWNYTDLPGFPESFFDGTAPDLDDLADHMDLGFPIWYGWNIEDEPYEVYMAHLSDLQTPKLGSFDRRGLIAQLTGYERV